MNREKNAVEIAGMDAGEAEAPGWVREPDIEESIAEPEGVVRSMEEIVDAIQSNLDRAVLTLARLEERLAG